MNTVVCAAAEILGNQTLIDSSREASIGAKWGNRFPKIGVSIKSCTFRYYWGRSELLNSIKHRRCQGSKHAAVYMPAWLFLKLGKA